MKIQIDLIFQLIFYIIMYKSYRYWGGKQEVAEEKKERYLIQTRTHGKKFRKYILILTICYTMINVFYYIFV